MPDNSVTVSQRSRNQVLIQGDILTFHITGIADKYQKWKETTHRPCLKGLREKMAPTSSCNYGLNLNHQDYLTWA